MGYMQTKHDMLIEDNKGKYVLYFAEIGEPLDDGRMLVKYGETEDLIETELDLRAKYGTAYYVKMFAGMPPDTCQSSLGWHVYYKKPVNGIMDNKVLAVTQSEFKKVKCFFKDEQERIRIEQKLEELKKVHNRYVENISELVSWTERISYIEEPESRMEVVLALLKSMERFIDEMQLQRDMFTDMTEEELQQMHMRPILPR
jgi:hypothetical protein